MDINLPLIASQIKSPSVSSNNTVKDQKYLENKNLYSYIQATSSIITSVDASCINMDVDIKRYVNQNKKLLFWNLRFLIYNELTKYIISV